MSRRELPTALGLAILLAVAPDAPAQQAEMTPPVAGEWRAWLMSPGGELPFGLILERGGDAGGGDSTVWRASLINGTETLPVPLVSWDGRTLLLDIDHYAATVTATPSKGGTRLDGSWSLYRGPGRTGELPFGAQAGAAPRFTLPPGEPDDVAGRWSVQFASDEQPSVGLLQRAADGTLAGTVLTSTGDFRFLAGEARGGRLLLSCFDGSHAFLFDAALREDGTLAGDFWSGDHWHDSFTARRDEQAALPDALLPSAAGSAVRVDDLVFPDLDGQPRSLGDPAFAGRARVLEIFGSWCPNCHDATADLVELHRRYGPRGLSIAGLAFERSGDPARDAAQVRKYAARHGVTWPLLLAGLADKDNASASLGILDRVRAFPTTIFLHADGRVRAVYSGYSGPATGAAHDELLRQFEALIEELLAEDAP